jgi:hypothetical protein
VLWSGSGGGGAGSMRQPLVERRRTMDRNMVGFMTFLAAGRWRGS